MAFLPISLDIIISLIALIVTLIGVSCFWIKPRLFLFTKNDTAPTLTNLQSNVVSAKKIETSDTSSFVDRMINSHKSMVIFYGTQTGTAENFAHRMVKQAKDYGISAIVCSPEEYNMEELGRLREINKHFALFLLATYGEGEPTDNAKEFYDSLHQDKHDLNHVNYAVFGLGSNIYPNYNRVGIDVDKRLNECGGIRICDIGLGDDSGNIEDDFLAWTTSFWETICEKYELEMNIDHSSMRQYKLDQGPFDAESIFTGEIRQLKSDKTQKRPFDLRNPYLASVITSRELCRKDSPRSCIHLEFDISNTCIKYETGDHIGIYPLNDEILVNRIGELLNFNLDEVISLVNIDKDTQQKYPFPCPCTYRTALTHYLDITSILKTQIIKDIAQYATDKNERDLLILMCSYSEEGKNKYKECIHDSYRSIVAVLEDFSSLKPPLDHLCELLPRLYPRYYSISSSSKVYPTRVHITAAYVHFQTSTKRIVKGVATNCFQQSLDHRDNDCHKSDRFLIYIRKSKFRLPSNFETPIIMIGPGTGLAPFRGFIQERHYYKTQGQSIGETILFYGCRNQSEDYLYEDELNYFVREESLELHVAYSRDQTNKIYVTHLLREHGEKLWKLIKYDNASIYVCGDAKNMAKDVHNMFIDIAQTYGQMPSEQATAFIKELTGIGRYSQDVWA